MADRHDRRGAQAGSAHPVLSIGLSFGHFGSGEGLFVAFCYPGVDLGHVLCRSLRRGCQVGLFSASAPDKKGEDDGGKKYEGGEAFHFFALP